MGRGAGFFWGRVLLRGTDGGGRPGYGSRRRLGGGHVAQPRTPPGRDTGEKRDFRLDRLRPVDASGIRAAARGMEGILVLKRRLAHRLLGLDRRADPPRRVSVCAGVELRTFPNSLNSRQNQTPRTNLIWRSAE